MKAQKADIHLFPVILVIDSLRKDPLTVIIDKINEKYGTHFTEMDKVLVQMENDYANQEKWQS